MRYRKVRPQVDNAIHLFVRFANYLSILLGRYFKVYMPDITE